MNKIKKNERGDIPSTIEGYNTRIGEINKEIEKLDSDNVNVGEVLTKVSELLNTYSSPEPQEQVPGKEGKDSEVESGGEESGGESGEESGGESGEESGGEEEEVLSKTGEQI